MFFVGFLCSPNHRSFLRVGVGAPERGIGVYEGGIGAPDGGTVAPEGGIGTQELFEKIDERVFSSRSFKKNKFLQGGAGAPGRGIGASEGGIAAHNFAG